MTAKFDKNKKFFYVKDLFLYFIAIAVVVVLFLSFVILPKTNDSFGGFNVSISNSTILTLSLDGEINVSNEYADKVEYSFVNDVYTITVRSGKNKEQFNKIIIDLSLKTAQVSESNCSNSKDCVYSPKISGSGAIYCAPHALKISAIGRNDFIPPTVG